MPYLRLPKIPLSSGEFIALPSQIRIQAKFSNRQENVVFHVTHTKACPDLRDSLDYACACQRKMKRQLFSLYAILYPLINSILAFQCTIYHSYLKSSYPFIPCHRW